MIAWFRRWWQARRGSALDAAAYSFPDPRAKVAAWRATLPDDLQAWVDAEPESSHHELMGITALTAPSDQANALRRHRRWTMPEPTAPSDASLQDKLQILLAHSPHPEDETWTAATIAAAFDGDFDQAIYDAMRDGTRTNGHAPTLLKVARFFQVEPTYFYPGIFVCSRGGRPSLAARRYTEHLIGALAATDA